MTTEDRGFEARNDASRERLARVLDRLTDADLARPVDGWTIGINLAHLAFWDRFMLHRWQEAEASGRDAPMSAGPPLFDLINDALAAEWARLDAASIRALVMDAAAALDAHIASLSDEGVAGAAAGAPRALDRSLHRSDHLDAIEAALGSR